MRPFIGTFQDLDNPLEAPLVGFVSDFGITTFFSVCLVILGLPYLRPGYFLCNKPLGFITLLGTFTSGKTCTHRNWIDGFAWALSHHFWILLWVYKCEKSLPFWTLLFSKSFVTSISIHAACTTRSEILSCLEAKSGGGATTSHHLPHWGCRVSSKDLIQHKLIII